jgi:hypothetical protein
MMHKRNSASSNIRFGRLKAICAGLIILAIGILRMRSGVQVVTHWTGQPMFSWGLITGGVLLIISAFIPQSWIAKAVGSRAQKKQTR